MKLRTKLFCAFLLMSVIGLILGAVGLVSISTLTRMSNEFKILQLEGDDVTKTLNGHNVWRQGLTEAVLVDGAFSGSLDPRTCSLGQWLDGEIAKAIDDEVIRPLLDDLIAPHAFIHVEAASVLAYMRAGNTEAARAHLVDNILPKTEEVISILTQIETRYAGIVEDKTNEIISAGTFLTALIVAFLAAAAIAGVLLSALVPPSILKPLTVLSTHMKKAADGDFSFRLPSHYNAEIGQLFAACNALIAYNDISVTNLKETVVQIRESAENMLSISSNMASNSRSLSDQTASVSASTEEFSAGMTQSSNALSTASANISAIASSIEEINSTISAVAAASEQTSVRVDQSNALVDSIQESISRASGSVTIVSEAFSSVAQSVDEINKSLATVSKHCAATAGQMAGADEKANNTNLIIQRLEAASKQIGKIVSVISDIADQTNMLALNAAIEAAGAGEAGKGFMVVANEVKELAKQTADSTDEIAAQIENMQKNMPEAVEAVSEITAIINGMTEFISSFAMEMTQQGRRSDQIADDSAAAAKRMSEITLEINRISQSALSVTRTVSDSSQGVNEIARSTAELVAGAQEIAMNSERVSNNISEINRAAKEMATGLMDISKTIQLLNDEAIVVERNADTAKTSSEALLSIANDTEGFISQFKIS